MDEDLKLPVTYKGEEREFPFRIVHQGYTTRYIVLVDEVELVIERDDSGELRAIIYNQEEIKRKLPERGLLQEIANVLAALEL